LVHLDPLLASCLPCGAKLRSNCIANPEIDLVRSLPLERRVGHHLIVLPHVEVYETARGLDTVERVQIEPRVLERSPEGLDQRVAKRNLYLGQDSAQVFALEYVVDVRVDVLAARVSDNRRLSPSAPQLPGDSLLG
jgi:hypothetical protein